MKVTSAGLDKVSRKARAEQDQKTTPTSNPSARRLRGGSSEMTGQFRENSYVVSEAQRRAESIFWQKSAPLRQWLAHGVQPYRRLASALCQQAETVSQAYFQRLSAICQQQTEETVADWQARLDVFEQSSNWRHLLDDFRFLTDDDSLTESITQLEGRLRLFALIENSWLQGLTADQSGTMLVAAITQYLPLGLSTDYLAQVESWLCDIVECQATASSIDEIFEVCRQLLRKASQPQYHSSGLDLSLPIELSHATEVVAQTLVYFDPRFAAVIPTIDSELWEQTDAVLQLFQGSDGNLARLARSIQDLHGREVEHRLLEPLQSLAKHPRLGIVYKKFEIYLKKKVAECHTWQVLEELQKQIKGSRFGVNIFSLDDGVDIGNAAQLLDSVLFLAGYLRPEFKQPWPQEIAPDKVADLLRTWLNLLVPLTSTPAPSVPAGQRRLSASLVAERGLLAAPRKSSAPGGQTVPDIVITAPRDHTVAIPRAR